MEDYLIKNKLIKFITKYDLYGTVNFNNNAKCYNNAFYFLNINKTTIDLTK